MPRVTVLMTEACVDRCLEFFIAIRQHRLIARDGSIMLQ